ncbi:MAG TPA: type IV pilin [Nitrososphaerales archaeon]|nr:type IV pilin [Nitrososphaerales archaeon]
MSSEFRRRLAGRRRRAVSEVVGAMLLLIVVVVAVGTFAYYLNYTQQQAQNRQTFINSVKNENLRIQNIFLSTLNTTATPQISATNLTQRITTINITVINLNLQSSNLVYIQVDGTWLKNFTSLGFNYFGGTYLIIPARATSQITLYTNFTKTPIYRNQSMQVTLLTKSGNYFETAYNPPSAIITEQLYPQQEGASVVDEPIFSSQFSTVSNETSIASYFWVLTQSPHPPCIISGSRAAFAFTSVTCPSPFVPTTRFNVSLTIEDSNGLTSNSNFPFAGDPNI